MMMYMMPVMMPMPENTSGPPPPPGPPASAVPPPPPPPPMEAESALFNAEIADLLRMHDSDTSSNASSEGSYYEVPDITELNRCTAVTTAGITDTCSICKEAIVPASIIRAIPCGHVFHIACLDRALEDRGTCPLCRRLIITPEV